MRHRNQLQAAVKNTKNLVMLKIEAVYVFLDVFIPRQIAKAQVAIVLGECEHMLGDLAAMAEGQRADRHQRGVFG